MQNTQYISQEGKWAEEPKDIKIELKPHQHRVLHEMIQLEESNRIYTSGRNYGILADNVGSGKSLSMLSLIAASKSVNIKEGKYTELYTEKDEQFELNEQHYGFEYDAKNEINTNLIIVPHGIFKEWQTYIKTETTLNCLYIEQKKDLLKLNEDDQQKQIIEQYDCVLLKATQFGEFVELFKTYERFTDYREPNKAENSANFIESEGLAFLNEHMVTTLQITKYFSKLQEVLRVMKEINIEEIEHRLNITKWINTMPINWDDESAYIHDLIEHLEEFAELDEKVSAFRKYLEITRSYYKPEWAAKEFTANMKNLESALLKNADTSDYYTDQEINKGNKHYFVNNLMKCDGLIFERVIIDESDSINIKHPENVCGKINWFITSSHENMNVCVFGCNDAEYQFKHKITLKNNPEFIEESFSVPEYIETQIMCRGSRNIEALAKCGFSRVVAAINAGDTNYAINIVGCEIVTKIGDISKAILHNMNHEYDSNEEKLTKYTGKLDNLMNMPNRKGVSYIKIEKYNEQIEAINNQEIALSRKISQLAERLNNIENNDCPICMDALSFVSTVPCCKASFCFKCITESLASKEECPLCRANIDMRDIIVVGQELDNAVERLNSKLEQLNIILKSEGKFLIFSEFDGTFKEIQEFLINNKIPYSKLEGNGNCISKNIEKFASGEIKVLLLNANFFGAGLNLQMATDVVIYHKMNPLLEMQVIGRGERPGRTQPLKVTRLVNEYEEYEGYIEDEDEPENDDANLSYHQ